MTNEYPISAGASSSGNNNSGYLSALEEAILKANTPVEAEEGEDLTVVGHTGIFWNTEANTWSPSNCSCKTRFAHT
jgi:hypothetical protein